MDTVLNILILLIPAVLVFLTALIFFNKMRDDQRKFQELLLRIEERKHSLPLQMKAYERLIIMLERITPNALVMRVNQGAMSCGQLQLELLKAVRSEFEHNISMQMYVSQTAWELTKNGRDEVLQMIQIAAAKAGHEASGMALSQEIFNIEAQTNNAALRQAIQVLRNEAQKMM